MRLSKIIGFIAVLTMIVCAPSSAVSASVDVSIDSATVDPGNTTTVDIIAHNVTELGEFGIKLEYDTNVVSVTDVQNNPDIPDSFGVSDTADDGSLSLVSTGMTKPSLTGAEVLLATVTLQAVGDASDECDLNITICKLKYNNGTDIEATEEDGVFKIAGDAAVSPICTVSVTNTTITPPQPTDITVTFSEKVQYILNIETDDGTVVWDWSGNRKASRTVPWNGTYETDGKQVPDGTYTVNLTVTNETTGLSGQNRTETIVVSSGDDVTPVTYVSIDSATVDPGNTTTVDIIAHNVTELGEFGIKLEYDTNVVSVTDVQNNPDIPDSFGVSDTADDGSLSLVSTGMTKPSLTGAEVLLATVTLQAVGDASDECDLNITICKLKYNNGTDIEATEEDGVFKIAGDAAVSPICTVSVTNTTIIPPQPTDITVTFSEKVQYILNIETDDGTVVWDWSGNRKASRTVPWNGTYETDGKQVPDGTYTVNLTVTNETTGLSGQNRTETIVVSSGDDVTPVTYVSIDSATVDPGNTTTVDIIAHNVTELGEFGIKLEYDTNVVSVTDVQNNPDIPDSFGVSDTADDGSLSLVSTGMTKPSLTGAEVLLATVTLQAVGDASDECDLNITICKLKYNNGTDIEATEEDGVFKIAGDAPTPIPTITSSTPASPVDDMAWATRTFSIEINQTVNVTWLINGSEVQTNESVTTASYTNTSAEVGCWNVSAVVSNANGDAMQEWTWIVTPGDVFSIDVESPDPLPTNIGMNGTFTATCYNVNDYLIDDATVTWNSSNPAVGTIDAATGYFEALHAGQTNVTATNGVTSDPVVMAVNGVGHSGNDTAPVIDDFVNVTGNYTGDANVEARGDPVEDVGEITFGLGDDAVVLKGVNVTVVPPIGAGEWVRIEMSYTEAELAALEIDKDTLDIYKFNEASEWELVRDQAYCTDYDRDPGVIWVKVTHLCTFALVARLAGPGDIPDDSIDTITSSGSGSGTYPPGWFDDEPPTPAPTATPEKTATPAPTEAKPPVTPPAVDEPVTPAAEGEATAKETKTAKMRTPGFGAVFMIAGLLAAVYLVLRRRE